MKKFAMLLILALLVLSVGIVFAQDSDVTVVEVPDTLVICPGHSVFRSIRLAADLLVQFSSVNGAWDVPINVVVQDTDNGYAVIFGHLELNCSSSATDVETIDRSEAFGLNETPPEPENPIGLAESQAGHLIVYQGPANLRSCDNPECSRIAIVRGGDTLIALGRNASNTWWYVQAGEMRGWIWSDLVRIRGDVTGIPIIKTEGEPVAPRVYIGFVGNPIFDVLSPEGKVICNIQGGQEFPLIGRTADDSWVWIEAPCIDGTIVQGWVEGSRVIIRNLGNVYVPVVGPEGP